MYEKALDLYEKMTLNPDNITYCLIFSACAQLQNDRAMKIGKKLLNQMFNHFRNDNVALNAAIHMVIKFGDIRSAERLFELIKIKTIVTYGAMINGYAINNEPRKCFKVFEQMKQENMIINECVCVFHLLVQVHRLV